MSRKCVNFQEMECKCKKLSNLRYLYLLPMAVCLAFGFIFIEMEKSYQGEAFDDLSENNHKVFNTLVDLNDSVPTSFRPFYKDTIVDRISNTDFTFGYTDHNQSNEILDSLRGLSLFDDNFLSEHKLFLQNHGETVIYLYKVNENNIWVFGTFDNHLIQKQHQGLSILIIVMIGVTFILNIALIFYINRALQLKL